MPGHALPDVKQRLAKLFKADAQKIDALFTGRAVPLKRNLDQATAEKYQAVLAQAGAQVSLQGADGGTAVKTPTAKAAEPSPHSQPTPAAKPAAKPAAGFTLAPVGTLLGAPRQQPQVAIADLSQFTLRAMDGELLDESEKPQAPAVAVAVGDYDIADAGADLLTAAERERPPLPEIEAGDFDIAEPGADLLEGHHQTPPPPQVRAGDWELAPVGSELGEKKKQASPPPPDTSKLKLAD